MGSRKITLLALEVVCVTAFFVVARDAGFPLGGTAGTWGAATGEPEQTVRQLRDPALASLVI